MPRPWCSMKLMPWAVTLSAARQKKPSLSGESSSTKMTILPLRISSMPSSMLAIGIANEVDGFSRKNDGLLSTLFQETVDVFSDQIRFKIDFITNPTGAQISVLQSKRDDRDRKTISRTIIDGKADTVHGHRPFRDQQ